VCVLQNCEGHEIVEQLQILMVMDLQEFNKSNHKSNPHLLSLKHETYIYIYIYIYIYYNALPHQSTSTTISCISKTALANYMTNQCNSMPKEYNKDNSFQLYMCGLPEIEFL
jgi:hypothetical protein